MDSSFFLCIFAALAIGVPALALIWQARSDPGPFQVSIVQVGAVPARFRVPPTSDAIEIHKQDVALTVHIGNLGGAPVTIGSYFFTYENTGRIWGGPDSFPAEVIEPLEIMPNKGYYVDVPIGNLYALAEMGLIKSQLHICFRDDQGHDRCDAFQLRK